MRNRPVPNLHGNRQRRRLVIVIWLAYVALAGGYLLLVAQASSEWRAERKKRIEESPAVWVAPYGVHYHQETHYGRHLSSPLSLYEATERGYEHCNICNPPLPAQLVLLPVWARYWMVILGVLSCSWVVVTLAVLYRRRHSIQQTRAGDSIEG